MPSTGSVRARRFRPFRVLTAAAVLALLSACAERESADRAAPDTLEVDTTTAGERQSIYAALQEEGRFSRLVAAIDSAGLTQTLSGPGPFTVFAPTDDAFASVQGGGLDEMLSAESKDRLREVLLHHIVNGERTSSDLRKGETVRALDGGDLSFGGEGDSLRVGSARVSETDLRASNGVIHTVDRVLAPSESAGSP